MKENSLVTIQNNLQGLLTTKAAALPQNFNQTRFLQNCMVVLQDTKDIQKYEPASVARTMLKGAFLDLDFFNGECYAIPYGDKLTFQTDYKGEVKILKKYSIQPIKDVYAKLVREGDEFVERIDSGIQTITFIPKPFNDAKIIGAFAVGYFTDDSMVYETMSVEDIENVRKTYSKMPDGKAWKNSYGEMCKKTVSRRLKKWIPIQFENTEQIEAFNDGGDAQFIEIKPDARPAVESPKPKDKKKDETDNTDDLIDIVMGLENMKDTKEISKELLKEIDDYLVEEKRDIEEGKELLKSCAALPAKSNE